MPNRIEQNRNGWSKDVRKVEWRENIDYYYVCGASAAMDISWREIEKKKLKKLQLGNCCSLIDIQSSNEICILNTKKENAYRIMWVRVFNNENWWKDYSFIIIGSIIHAFAMEICISVSSSWMLQMEHTEEMHKLKRKMKKIWRKNKCERKIVNNQEISPISVGIT